MDSPTISNDHTSHSTLEVRNPFLEHELQPPPEVHKVHPAPEVKDHAADGTRDVEKQGQRAPVLFKVPGLCTVRRRLLHFVIFVAVIGVIAMGLALGVKLSRKHDGSGNPSSEDKSSSGSPGDSATTNDKTNLFALRADTRITAANFTDEFGNTNALVFYQLQNNAIYMSAFNSSVDKWIVSPVIDGRGNVTLDDVRPGTALGVDIYFHNSTNRYVHLYYQDPNNVLKLLFRYTIFTDSASSAQDWISPFAPEVFTASNGSSIASYGRQSYASIRSSYMFFQTETDGVRGGFLWGRNDQGYSSMLFPKAAKPSEKTHLAVVGIPAINTTSRSLSIFYHSSAGVLAQLLYNGNGVYSSQPLPRGLGARSAIAAFGTGFNGTDSTGSDDVGYQVLSVDPDADTGVLSTYYRLGRWVAGEEVTALSDCASRATMIATADRRVYCVVDGKNGTEIGEWKWTGDAAGSTDQYSKYDKMSTVDTSVS
ncbi:hypothetical protein B0T10DRAFT_499531 [Thelonectria olida]|uniref:Fucose-specific lectin n=1 Tax=Thelonectria olida TaxID=1576542 RepID=A0A9P8VUQ5_9HYPO|nr:hypothetical protein B0T10DRAFT_499531 [Thelonectria olida]